MFDTSAILPDLVGLLLLLAVLVAVYWVAWQR